MAEFKIGQRVIVKRPAYFGFDSIQRAFERAEMKGTVERFTDGTIAVKAEGSAEWDYFLANELLPMETE